LKNTLLETAHLIGLRNTSIEKNSTFHSRNDISEKDMYENNDFYPISVDGKNSNSLNVFLRKSSLLCESLMNEQSNLKNEKKKEMSQSKVADGKIFISNVITLGVRNKMSEEKESEMVINVLVVVVILITILVIFILSFCQLCCNYHYYHSTVVVIIVLHFISRYR
jgi:hypothetical protein